MFRWPQRRGYSGAVLMDCVRELNCLICDRASVRRAGRAGGDPDINNTLRTSTLRGTARLATDLPSDTRGLCLEFLHGQSSRENRIMPMALVAVEQYFPKAQRVIDDGLAARLLPLGGMIFVRFVRPRWR